MTMIEAAPIADQETIFGRLAVQPADPLLSIIAAFRGDSRPHKIALGVGVYRDDAGRTPVLLAVKAAESRLVAAQDTKAFFGVEGNGADLARRAELAGPCPAEPGRRIAYRHQSLFRSGVPVPVGR